MAYQQKTWQSGEVITSAALNNIESGISDLIDHNTKMSSSFTSNKLEIGSGSTLIKGENGSLTVADTITTKKLVINTEGNTEGTATFPVGSTVTVSGTIIVPDLNADSNTNAAVPKNYVDGKFALQSTKITASTGLSGGGTLEGDRTLSLKAATDSALGGIKVGTGLKIDTEGKLDVNIQTANENNPGLMSTENFNKLAGLNIKIGNTTISPGQSDNAFDLSSQTTNNINIYGEGQFRPSNGTVNLKGVVTGVKVNNTEINAPTGNAATSGLIDIGQVVRSIKVNENSTLSPNNDGIIDMSSAIPDISGKANSANPVFTGTITLGSVTLNETQLSNLLNLLNDGGEGT